MATLASVPLLITPRFALRPLERSDAAALLPTLGDPAQCRYLSRGAFADDAELWDWLAAPGWPGLTWIATDRASGEVAGRFVAIPFAQDAAVFEIGTITCAHRQGEGVARECAAALIAHLFAEGARLLTAEIDTRNAPSLRLFDSLGFTHTRTVHEAEITHIGPCDLAQYELHSSHASNA
ncbi:MAG: GNAT family N-acetyltransferase [Erythrobacter sp.]|jgi:RimJ/RimL family protein N-acetyltransferase|nr:GNAT family N-acetyltransferase [Erythrobacter sp.]